MPELPRQSNALTDQQRRHIGDVLAPEEHYDPDCPLCVEIAQALDLCWSCGSGVHYSEACPTGRLVGVEREAPHG